MEWHGRHKKGGTTNKGRRQVCEWPVGKVAGRCSKGREGRCGGRDTGRQVAGGNCRQGRHWVGGRGGSAGRRQCRGCRQAESRKGRQ